jgi:hypothetical protein
MTLYFVISDDVGIDGSPLLFQKVLTKTTANGFATEATFDTKVIKSTVDFTLLVLTLALWF